MSTLAAPAAGAARTATAQWQIAPRPTPIEPNGDLQNVSCSSQNACVATGHGADRQGRDRPLAERWNGSDWAPDGLPRPPTSVVDLSCAAARTCVVIDYAYFEDSQRYVERLGPNGWTRETLPQPRDTTVSYTRVDCPSVHWCVAVGSAYRPGYDPYGIAAVWDGHSWMASPLPDVGLLNIRAVSCDAPRSCLASGITKVVGDAGARAPRAVQLSGSEWQPTAAFAFPQPYLTVDDVSCSGPSACTAAGTRRDCEKESCVRYASVLAERWDGTTWTSQTVPAPYHRSVRGPRVSVSCASATLCAASGNIIGNGHAVLTWDGSAWTQHDIPRPGSDFRIADVACAGTICQVVGGAYPPVGRAQVLVRTFTVDSGAAVHFLPVAVSEPPGAANYTLTDVSCTSPTSCVAVGVLSTDAAKHALYLARWDGVNWTDETLSVATAIPTATGRVISPAVSCSTPGQCMIVGAATVDGDPYEGRAFSVQIDGDAETVRSLGTSTSADGADVSCTASDACTAAIDVVDCGFTFGCGRLPDFERWNGTSWQQQTPDAQLDPDSPDGSRAVSCGSATGCVAIGLYDAQVWNGSTWHAETLPKPEDGSYSPPTGVSCTAARTCMIVGADPYTGATYAVRLSGASRTLLPIDGATSSALAVSCAAAAACSAAGPSDGAPDAARWNGTTWASQDLPAATGQIDAVSCFAPDRCMAVGANTVITEGF